MDLYKNFELGGLFQAGRRMAAPWGAFRRFTNAFKDATNTLKPYGRGEEVSNAPTIPAGNGATGFSHMGPLSSQFFRKGILQFHGMEFTGSYRGIFSYLNADGVTPPIMQPFRSDGLQNSVDISKHMAHQPSGNFSTATVARKAYMNSMVNTTDFDDSKPISGFTPEEKFLMSFDGQRLRGAGLPLPWLAADNGGVPAAHYIRTVYMTIGIDGEAIFSPYLQQRLSNATRDVYAGGYSAYPGTKLPDATEDVGLTFPTFRGAEDHLFEELKTLNGFGASGSNSRYFDKRFLLTNSSSIVANELTVDSLVRSPTGLAVGDWLMVSMAPIGTISADLWMFQLKTVGDVSVFEKNFKYLDRNSVTWIDANLEDMLAIWDDIDAAIRALLLSFTASVIFTNLFSIISYSTTASSGYRVSAIVPMAWDSDIGGPTVLSTPVDFDFPWAGVVSSFMADWYDTTAVKTTFPPLKGITSYKELLVGFDSNAIYFQDITLGGSTEMVSGLSNLIPFGSEFGDLTAICGAEDFFFFSRERRNYVLTGDIAGSAFNITECDTAVGGAYNAKCVSNAWSGQIIFMNKSGIYSVNSSGVIRDISEEIKGLFLSSNRDGNLFQKDIFLTVAQTRASGFDGGLFKFILEDFRGFIAAFTAQSTTTNALTIANANMLVHNTKSGKWYEFEGGETSSAEVVDGNFVVLGIDRATEDGVMRGVEKQLLVTQGMTVDQPSMEKQICQLKMFGEFTETEDSIKGMTVGQLNDWVDFDQDDRSSWNTNAEYVEKPLSHYYHKQRLDSSKPQVTSIILESLATGSFTIEGMEIEGVVAQSGMKK